MQLKHGFLRSFVWVALLSALTMGVTDVTLILFMDFVHGNPNRSQANAIETMILFMPAFALIGPVGALLVFGPPQIFQAILSKIMTRLFGTWANAIVIAALPIIALVTWYSYDYLVPRFEPSQIPDDWEPYQHGMTTTRYLYALGAQLPVALFNVAYVSTVSQHRLRKSLITFSILAASIGGLVIGYRLALVQYGYMDALPP